MHIGLWYVHERIIRARFNPARVKRARIMRYCACMYMSMCRHWFVKGLQQHLLLMCMPELWS